MGPQTAGVRIVHRPSSHLIANIDSRGSTPLPTAMPQSATGPFCLETMGDGDLVDDLTVIGIVAEKLAELQGPFILEGFPRTPMQAEALDKDLGAHGLTGTLQKENVKAPRERKRFRSCPAGYLRA